MDNVEGLLLVDKPIGRTSFSLIAALRRILGVKKIGHAGTLDPFASGVMILLVGRNYTKLSDSFLHKDKEYIATMHLGVETDTMDCEGSALAKSDYVPTEEQVHTVIESFQGEIEQIPPMFSAKKVNGKKLYELARKGKTIERKPVKVFVKIEQLDYTYPLLRIRVNCSKGTYIRALASDIGQKLNCYAHLIQLQRTKSGSFTLDQCLDGNLLRFENFDREQVIAKLVTELA